MAIWKPEDNLGELVLSFYHSGPGTQTQDPTQQVSLPTEPFHQLTCKLLMKAVTEVLIALRRMCDIGRRRASRRRNMINMADPCGW